MTAEGTVGAPTCLPRDYLAYFSVFWYFLKHNYHKSMISLFSLTQEWQDIYCVTSQLKTVFKILSFWGFFSVMFWIFVFVDLVTSHSSSPFLLTTSLSSYAKTDFFDHGASQTCRQWLSWPRPFLAMMKLIFLTSTHAQMLLMYCVKISSLLQ
jgi:hypothetical protein